MLDVHPEIAVVAADSHCKTIAEHHDLGGLLVHDAGVDES
jgi:hypothetical protein